MAELAALPNRGNAHSVCSRTPPQSPPTPRRTARLSNSVEVPSTDPDISIDIWRCKFEFRATDASFTPTNKIVDLLKPTNKIGNDEEGAFEQPGARALQDFISTRNEHVQLERAANAVKVAQQRVVEAEEAAREAEARAVVAHAELDSVVDRSASVTGRSSGSETQSLISRMSNETIMRELSQKHPPPTKRVTSRESGSETQSLVSRISKGQQLPPPTTWATSRKAGSETSLVSRASDERLYTQKLPRE
ncbi:hypothetical protein K438DRAFT_1971439 [Mycena galopus ATCC 62051]|nr:hypothetical protein K438DRAFT_1971439 [Mycena galopus ATCC 62051]